MTNFEWLKSLSVEKFMEYACKNEACDKCAFDNTDQCPFEDTDRCTHNSCEDGIKEWLLSEHITYRDTLERVKNGESFNSDDLKHICNALVKQIPVKTLIKARLSIPVCPICGKSVQEGFSFCRGCGQKLKWSDDDED